MQITQSCSQQLIYIYITGLISSSIRVINRPVGNTGTNACLSETASRAAYEAIDGAKHVDRATARKVMSPKFFEPAILRPNPVCHKGIHHHRVERVKAVDHETTSHGQTAAHNRRGGGSETKLKNVTAEAKP